MAKNHYQTLGIKPASTPDEIKSAYRKIVLQHHPDHSSDPRSTEIFISATKAYEVLSDPDARRHYDLVERKEQIQAEQIKYRDEAAARTNRRPAPKQPTPAPRRPAAATTTQVPKASDFGTPSPAKGFTTVDVTRLTMLFTRGQFNEAEKLAKKILTTDVRQPIPYAVLGDIHRQKGELQQAAKMYAFAVQMDPRNSLYQQRHEELIGAIDVGDSARTSGKPTPAQAFAPALGAFIILLACFYLVLSNDAPLIPGFKLISTWTIGLIVMLFLSGVVIGSTFSAGALLDRYSSVATTAIGRKSPSVALAWVAAVNFWVAAMIYVAIGLMQNAFNFSTTRLVVAVSGITLLISLACSISQSNISFFQTFLWGGNLIYLGSLVGWMVADSFRQ